MALLVLQSSRVHKSLYNVELRTGTPELRKGLIEPFLPAVIVSNLAPLQFLVSD